MLREALDRARLFAMAPDEAAAYFVTHRDEGLTQDEQALLADWLASDEAHARALAQAERGWNAFDAADGHEILDAMRAHARDSRPRRRDWRPLLAVASVVLLLMASSLFFLRSLQPPAPGGAGAPQSAGGWTRYASAHGEIRDIALPDGSRLTLDTDSAVLARFAGAERAIRLERGRGFFEVAKDPTRPFAVTAAGRRVVALGTRFEVDLGSQALRVTLLRGRVAVEPLTAGGQKVLLDPGQQFFEKAGTATVRRVEFDEDGPDWRRGMIDLDDMPLDQAAAAINRYARDAIVIRDPNVATMRVSGRFRATDAERFARTVADIHPLRVIRRDHAIELVAKK